MIYDDQGDCVTCSSIINGCKLCVTKDKCVHCEDNTKYPLPIIDAYSKSILQCSAGMKVFANCDIKQAIRERCANCTQDASLDVCKDCVQKNFTEFYTATFAAECTGCDMYKFFTDDGPDGCSSTCINKIISTDLQCTCTDPKCKVCFEGRCFQCQDGYYLNDVGVCTKISTATQTKRFAFFFRPFEHYEAETDPLIYA